jgi:hypothetical protein
MRALKVRQQNPNGFSRSPTNLTNPKLSNPHFIQPNTQLYMRALKVRQQNPNGFSRSHIQFRPFQIVPFANLQIHYPPSSLPHDPSRHKTSPHNQDLKY